MAKSQNTFFDGQRKKAVTLRLDNSLVFTMLGWTREQGLQRKKAESQSYKRREEMECNGWKWSTVYIHMGYHGILRMLGHFQKQESGLA